jgi:hypothetical protein
MDKVAILSELAAAVFRLEREARAFAASGNLEESERSLRTAMRFKCVLERACEEERANNVSRQEMEYSFAH